MKSRAHQRLQQERNLAPPNIRAPPSASQGTLRQHGSSLSLSPDRFNIYVAAIVVGQTLDRGVGRARGVELYQYFHLYFTTELEVAGLVGTNLNVDFVPWNRLQN